MPHTKKKLKKFAKELIPWVLPSKLHTLLNQKMDGYFFNTTATERAVLSRNAGLNGKHAGERVFILACGPSINKQDLSGLKNETCISVNNFFVHPLESTIRPAYHFVSDLGNSHALWTEGYCVRWFQEMEEKLASRTLFLSLFDRRIVEKHQLFRDRQVHYYKGSRSWNIQDKEIDLSKTVAPFLNVTIGAIQAALGLGFSEIYLLGCDHDWIMHFGYGTHFYKKDQMLIASHHNYSEAVGDDLGSEFVVCANVWGQYREIRKYADRHGVKIFNATEGGILDVFPQVSLAEALETQGAHKTSTMPRSERLK